MYEQVESFILSEGRKRFPHHSTTTNEMRFVVKHLETMSEYWRSLFHDVYKPKIMCNDDLYKLEESFCLFAGLPGTKTPETQTPPENPINAADTFGEEKTLIEIFDKILFVDDVKLPIPTFPAERALFDTCLYCMRLFYLIGFCKASGGDIFVFSMPLLFHMAELSQHFAGFAHLYMGLAGGAIKESRAALKRKIIDNEVDLKKRLIVDFIESKGSAWREDRGQNSMAKQIVKHLEKIAEGADETIKKDLQIKKRAAINYLKKLGYV